ncbi:hypothetical protein J2809_001029 [Arthrobacter pascens]|nr:hypothetical protein [Arthrobacter pascens]
MTPVRAGEFRRGPGSLDRIWGSETSVQADFPSIRCAVFMARTQPRLSPRADLDAAVKSGCSATATLNTKAPFKEPNLGELLQSAAQEFAS